MCSLQRHYYHLSSRLLQLVETNVGVASISGHGHQPLADLEEGLVDNLLNFAGTPKVGLQIPEPI